MPKNFTFLLRRSLPKGPSNSSSTPPIANHRHRKDDGIGCEEHSSIGQKHASAIHMDNGGKPKTKRQHSDTQAEQFDPRFLKTIHVSDFTMKVARAEVGRATVSSAPNVERCKGAGTIATLPPTTGVGVSFQP